MTFIFIIFLLYGCTFSKSHVIDAAASGDIVSFDTRDDEGKTALIHAVIAKDIAIVQELIKKGADVNARDNEGKTALIHAVIAKDIAIVQELIKRGADVNVVFDDVETPLSLALDFKLELIKDELLKAGAEQNETAMITFIRGYHLFYMGGPAYISIGGNRATLMIKAGEKKSIRVRPGKCSIEIYCRLWLGQHKFNFEAKTGGSYYFKISPRIGSMISRFFGIELGQYVESKFADNPGEFELTPLINYEDK